MPTPCQLQLPRILSRWAGDRMNPSWTAATLGPRDGEVVYEAAGGRVGAIEIATGRSTVPVQAGGVPLRRGSTAPGGAESAGDTVVLAPGGRAHGIGLQAYEPARGIAVGIEEVGR